MNQPKSRIPAPPVSTSFVDSIPKPSIPDNLSKANDDIKDLNFKVDPSLHRRFKLVASAWGMSMKDLLEASFNTWVDQHGEQPKDLDDLIRR